jgi:DNA-binding transcriptional regulator LsrR (DeoR family)
MVSSDVPASGAAARFPVPQMMLAARMYYLEDLTQAEIARRLDTSRASVSRLLSEARRQGIVRIDIAEPEPAALAELGRMTASVLGLKGVHLVESGTAMGATGGSGVADGRGGGSTLGVALGDALRQAELHPGDVLLTASGRMVYEASRAELPRIPGVVVVPMLGGQDEPEVWYQPNEITRGFSDRLGGRPTFLHSPALPGPELYPILRDEPSIRRVLDLWATARCAVVGVGMAPLSRASIPAFVPTDAVSLREAVGDVVSRFYDRDGQEVAFPGSDRMMATPLAALRDIPVVIAVAVGPEKVDAILVAARSRYFTRLVTDGDTAELLLAAALQSNAAHRLETSTPTTPAASPGTRT